MTDLAETQQLLRIVADNWDDFQNLMGMWEIISKGITSNPNSIISPKKMDCPLSYERMDRPLSYERMDCCIFKLDKKISNLVELIGNGSCPFYAVVDNTTIISSGLLDDDTIEISIIDKWTKANIKFNKPFDCDDSKLSNSIKKLCANNLPGWDNGKMTRKFPSISSLVERLRSDRDYVGRAIFDPIKECTEFYKEIQSLNDRYLELNHKCENLLVPSRIKSARNV